MRIIGKYKDYYDSLQEEDGNIFVRDEKSINKTDEKYLIGLYKLMPGAPSISGYTSGEALVFLCGEVYPIYYIRNDIFCGFGSKKLGKTYCAQCPSEFYTILRDKLKIPEENIPKPKRYSFFRENEFSDYGNNNLKYHLKTQSKRLMDIFYSTKSPVLVVFFNKEVIISTATPLGNFGFQSVVSPFDAYHRINHFITNDLVHDPLSDFKMSDELKRDSKGFDKYSFRKAKEVR